MMKKEKSLAAQLMAKARWAKTSKKQRSDHAKAMVEARERKKHEAKADFTMPRSDLGNS